MPPMERHARYTIDCDILPKFTAAYLRVAGGECAFIETHTSHAQPKLLAALAEHGKRPEDVRYIVVTHAHLDHAAGAGALLAKCPNATLLAHPRAARHLVDPAKLTASAKSVYGEERFARLYGTLEPAPADRVRALEDGETFELGGATLRVLHTAGHAKHHFVVDDPEISTVYTGDTFGLVYPALQRGIRFAIATTSPTDFDPVEARRSIERVVGLGREAACLTHFDEVCDVQEVASQVRAWIDRSEGWMEEAAKSEAPASERVARIAGALREAFDRDLRARGLVPGAADWDVLALDIDLNAQGIAFAADKRRHAA